MLKIGGSGLVRKGIDAHMLRIFAGMHADLKVTFQPLPAVGQHNYHLQHPEHHHGHPPEPHHHHHHHHMHHIPAHHALVDAFMTDGESDLEDLDFMSDMDEDMDDDPYMVGGMVYMGMA